MIDHLVVFGATGDVAKRYIFPALAHVLARKGLSSECTITGVGRRDWTTPQFQEHVSELLGKHRPPVPPRSRKGLLSLLKYICIEDLSNPKQIATIFQGKTGPTLIYLGLPSQVCPSVLEALSHVSLPSGSRIIIEKPFGLSYDQSKDLNTLLHRQFPEKSVFRIDHFLGMPIVSTIFGLRFANQDFKPIWNRHHINMVEVIWEETLALEGRADYYDRAGALKDMIQNHLLQLLAVLTLERPESIESPDFRDKRVELFKSVRKLSKAEIREYTVRARYKRGEVLGVRVPDYARESGVVSDRKTETFAQITLWVDNERWQNVPFVLRSGKALGQDRKEIRVHFNQMQGEEACPFLKEGHNLLRLNLASQEVNPELVNFQRNEEMTQERIHMDDGIPAEQLPPYGRLFLEAMSGKSRLFIRNDEIEEMWKIIQPIADAWTENEIPLQIYRAGSTGPPIQDKIMMTEYGNSRRSEVSAR